MATIERRKGTHRVKVQRQGVPPLTATFTRLAEAKKWAQMTESAVLEGRHFTATEAKRHTLGDLIDHHFSEVLPQKRPSTIPTQTPHLHGWKSQPGHFLFADVTPAIVVAYRNMRTYGRANATVNRYLAVLSQGRSVPVGPAKEALERQTVWVKTRRNRCHVFVCHVRQQAPDRGAGVLWECRPPKVSPKGTSKVGKRGLTCSKLSGALCQSASHGALRVVSLASMGKRPRACVRWYSTNSRDSYIIAIIGLDHGVGHLA
jgi:hypothetical protein